MDIDFSIVLVSLVSFCGLLWFLDSLLNKKSRMAAAEQYRATKAKGKSDKEVADTIAILSQDPLIIEYAKSFFPVLLIVLVLRSFLIEPFQIPTGSMIPTLEVGDFILVNKYAYGVRLPIIGTKLMDIADPKRGEVMVFIPPHENKYYIKRVIGLPGDTVRYQESNLYINGELVAKNGKSFVKSVPFEILNNFNTDTKKVADFRFESSANKIRVIDKILITYVINSKIIIKNSKVNKNPI